MTEPVNTTHQILTRIFSLAGLYVRSLDSSIIIQLIKLGYDSPDKIFSLTNEVLISLEGVPDKTVGKLVTELENAKQTTLPRLLYALGFPGDHTLRYRLLAAYPDWGQLVKAALFRFCDVEGLDETTVSDICRFFLNIERLTLIDRLREQGVHWNEYLLDKDGYFVGKNVVVTGTLQHLNRKKVKEILLSQGAFFSDKISSKTDVLIVGEKPGSKLSKADNLGIKTIDEKEWQMLTGFIPPAK